VDRHCWIQFELDRQLAAAAREARDGRLPLGLYTDLAVGSAPDGADPWLFPRLFVEGAHAGAPPDDYSSSGQDWGFQPLDPHRLRADGYRYWVRLLRAGFAHARALRIDHALGLFRLYWIPAGRPGSEGAYVRYPTSDLLGILALESQRHRAVVVAEDLGTIPREVPGTLASWGVLSSKVLYFEREDGGFRPSSAYSSRALVTANTHDLPPLAGFFADRDLALRQEVGQMSADEVGEARARRDRERAALLWRLREEGCLPPGEGVPSAPELCAAVNAFLCRTPSPLVGISLDDVAGELDPVNLPGVPVERWPSWSRRMRLALEELPSDPDAARALAGASSRRLKRQPAALAAREGAA
jgi:4-alpha-glucanotransferase